MPASHAHEEMRSCLRFYFSSGPSGVDRVDLLELEPTPTSGVHECHAADGVLLAQLVVQVVAHHSIQHSRIKYQCVLSTRTPDVLKMRSKCEQHLSRCTGLRESGEMFNTE
jgi:hypothetical protein